MTRFGAASLPRAPRSAGGSKVREEAPPTKSTTTPNSASGDVLCVGGVSYDDADLAASELGSVADEGEGVAVKVDDQNGLDTSSQGVDEDTSEAEEEMQDVADECEDVSTGGEGVAVKVDEHLGGAEVQEEADMEGANVTIESSAQGTEEQVDNPEICEAELEENVEPAEASSEVHDGMEFSTANLDDELDDAELSQDAKADDASEGHDAMEFSTALDLDDEEVDDEAEAGAADVGPKEQSQGNAVGGAQVAPSRAAALCEDDPEIISDEGKALAQALREARAALEAARQYVTSPWLDSCAAPASPPRGDVEVEGTLVTDHLNLEEESGSPAKAVHTVAAEAVADAAASDASGQVAPPTPPSQSPTRRRTPSRRPPGRPRSSDCGDSPVEPTPPSQQSPTRRRTPSRPPAHRSSKGGDSKGSRSGTPGLGGPPGEAQLQQRIAQLHARFGENAARERVQRAKSLDRDERKAWYAAERARALKAEEEKEVADAARHAAHRRAASERRAARQAQLQDEERRATESAQREVDSRAGKLYASSAARRAASEKADREAMARDVLADLHTLQSERRKLGDAKGKELQQRCKESDWRHAKSIVEQKRKMPARGPSPVLPPSEGEPRGGTSIPTLPRVLPSPRGRGRGPSQSRRGAAASQVSSGGSVHLPPICG